jgi:hypothetical protein
MTKKKTDDLKTCDIMYRTALLTQGYLNQFYAKNNKSLSLFDFIKIQRKSYEEAKQASDKEGRVK